MPRKFRGVYSRLELVKKFFNSHMQGSKYEGDYQDIEKYCMFIGYPRSGHSLVGSLLDAHPYMLIAHELDALRYFQVGFSKKQLYHLIITNSVEFNQAKREWTGYTYFVPNQWNGRYKKLKIIGDKKGSKSTFRIGKDPNLLKKLEKTMDVELKILHITRNPFDNISRIYLRKNAKREISLDQCIDFYFSRAKTNHEIIQRVDKSNLMSMKLESLVEDPRKTISEICDFLGMSAPDDYLNDCASIVFPSPKKSRLEVDWEVASISLVQDNIQLYPFLSGYIYEE